MSHPQLDLSSVRTYSVRERENKVATGDFARVLEPGASFSSFFESLPDILAGRNCAPLWMRLSLPNRTTAKY
jgi:hypothetical protein